MTAPHRSTTIAAVAYTLAMATTAVVAAWPVYATGRFIVLAAAAVVGGLALVLSAARWSWPGWMLPASATGLFVVVGLVVAVGTPWSDPGAALGSVRDLLAGVVTGFKDLLTVDLPVGDYRNLLVPALVVLLVGTIATVQLASRPDRFAAFAVVTGLGMPLFGLLFGRTVTSATWRIGPVAIPAPVETAVGAAALVATVAWLAWRATEERRAALRRAADVTGVRVSRRRSASDRRRLAGAAGMIAIAVAVGAVAAPAVAGTRPREVLRSATGPELAISRAVRPRAADRANFADAAADEVLFRVTAVSGPLPDRIRIATLSSYDGAVFRVADPQSAGAQFRRVPSRLDGGAGAESAARVEIDGLRGIWLPTFGALEQIAFDGPAAADLEAAFYYSPEAAAAVDTASGGLRAGDVYTVTATQPTSTALSVLEPPGVEPSVEVPDSVATWIRQQEAGTGGAALQTLVDRLRERGYLSHALAVPDAGASWTQTLGEGYTFQPSASGHSLARIDAMFQKLLDREVAAAGEGGGSLVAAVGDDEQFAVAAALIAEQLGFPARVVVGARLAGADEGVPPCAEGVCRGVNVTAWTEIATRSGEWVPIDVTPQHDVGVDTDTTRERDPEVPTEVRPEGAEEVVPPDPVQQDTDDPTDPEPAGPDLAVVLAVLRTVAASALVLGIVAGPLLVVVAAKALRRRTRRTAAGALGIVGGWDEYVDAAVDHGLPAPRADTRVELARRYDTPHGSALAALADRTVFSDADPTDTEAAEFWRIVDAERAGFGRDTGLWRRLLAAVSLNSFTRQLAPVPGRARASRITERRGRRPRGDVR